MPLDYHIDGQKKLVTLHGTGVVTDEELVACVERLRADPALRLNMPALADVRDATRMEVTGLGINAMLAVMHATANPESTAKVAIVTGSDSSAPIARLLEALAEAQNTVVRFRAFTDRGLAQRWLGEP